MTTFTVNGGAGNDKILGAENVGGVLVTQNGGDGDDIVYGSSGTQAAEGAGDTAGQVNIANLGAGDD